MQPLRAPTAAPSWCQLQGIISQQDILTPRGRKALLGVTRPGGEQALQSLGSPRQFGTRPVDNLTGSAVAIATVRGGTLYS